MATILKKVQNCLNPFKVLPYIWGHGWIKKVTSAVFFFFFSSFARLGRYIKFSNGTLATTTREQFTRARDLKHKYNEM